MASCGLVLDDVETLFAKTIEVVDHRLEDFGGMSVPLHFVNDAQRVASAVRAGDVAGVSLVGDVGVVFEWAGWFDDVHTAALFAAREGDGEFGGPDGGFQERSEVDVVRDATFVVVRRMTGDDMAANREWDRCAVEIRACDVITRFIRHGDVLGVRGLRDRFGDRLR